MFAVIALSLTLVAGLAGQISLGQAGFVGVGAYTSALLVKDHGWSFWLALPAAGLMAAIVGAIVIGPTLRLSGHYVSIATLAIGGGVTAALLNLEPITRGPLGITTIPPPSLFGHEIVSAREYYLLTLGVFLACGAVVALLQRSHLGRAWRAIREDEIAAASLGVPVRRYKALAFALGSFVAGVGGSLLAHQYSFINPSIFGITVSIQTLTIVVLGGLSNVLGAAVGAAVLVGMPELLRPLADARPLLFGVLLILLVRFRPQGLLGSD
jgi:branched-chain amino acid transport system permease protein